jgi:SAM-dependent methyltransferase
MNKATPDAWRNDSLETINYFSELVKEHGIESSSVDWANRASQERRFEILAEIGCLNDCTVLDVGCGLGDLLPWLQQRYMNLKYSGIDVTPDLIAQARRRFPSADFRICDILDFNGIPGNYDYAFASGIFYRRKADPYGFMAEILKKMFHYSRRGVAFNTLSTWASHHEKTEFYADPLRTIQLVQQLTRSIVLRHDYHPGDFTIYLRKTQE